MLQEPGIKKFQLTSDITAEDLGFGLILKYQRRLYTSFTLSALGIVFAGYLVLEFYTISADDAITTVLPVVVIAGSVLLYWITERFLDTATITVTKQKIDVKRGPIPFLKDFSVEASNVSQVFHERRVINYTYGLTRRWVPDTTAEGNINVRYVLGVVTVDKRKLIFLKDIVSEGDAKALESEIERWLGIVNRPVEDEMRSILAGSGFLKRLTYSSWSGGFLLSPLYYAILGAAYIIWGSIILASGEILVGRWRHKTISIDDDPLTFSIIVLAILATAGWCLYKSWRAFVNTE